jgi:proteasome accessory factor B
VLQATLSRTPVRFRYRRPGQTEATERHLQPWGVVTADEKWYVVGLDTDRGEPRMFRLSRIEGEVATDGRAGSFERPAGTDVRALTQSLAPAARPTEAVVLVRSGAGRGLRRSAEEVEEQVRPGWDRVRLRDQGGEGLVATLLGFGDAVVVEEPAELRAEVRDRLAALVGREVGREVGAR